MVIAIVAVLKEDHAANGSHRRRVRGAGEIRPGLAWLPQSPGQWHQYAEGYRDAAESLYTKWREGPIQPDYLAYPMVYLYRHYVELMLKEFLLSAKRAGLIQLPENWECNHNLKKLWDRIHPLLGELFPNEPERSTKRPDLGLSAAPGRGHRPRGELARFRRRRARG